MSEELKAIETIGKQIEGFKKELGAKADKASMEEVNSALAEMRKILDKLEEGAEEDAEEAAAAEEELEKNMKLINGHIEKFGKQIEELRTEIAIQKDNGKPSRKTLVKQEDLEAFIKATFVDPTREKSAKTHNHASVKMNTNMVLKAAEIMGEPEFFEGAAGTQTDVFTGRYIDPTLYQRKRKRNLILDHFAIESVTVPKLYYMEKKEVSGDSGSSVDVGGADWILSGAQKPQRSFRVTTGSVEAKKVAIFGTVDDKLLRDVPSLNNWLQEDFSDEMKEAYNDALLNNDPAVNPEAPLGLKENAIQYVVTTAFDEAILDPNEIDSIVAAAAYMRSLKEQPAVAFVSSDIFYKMHILKDLQAKYQNDNLVYTNTAGQLFVAGVQIVDVDEEDVPSTHLLLIGAEVGFKIKNYGSMVFERGLNGEDFRHDRTSYRGYQEVLSYIAEHRNNSVLYDTFANIITAIAEPAGS